MNENEITIRTNGFGDTSVIKGTTKFVIMESEGGYQVFKYDVQTLDGGLVETFDTKKKAMNYATS